MPSLSRQLKRLKTELLALGEETMLIEELDGFIAGLLVCPDLIKPGEWIPIVWSRDDAEPEPAFDDLDHVNRVLGLIMEHYNAVARIFMECPDSYSPLFAVDERNGDILWEFWIEGFENAVKLRSTTWQSLLDTDVETAMAMRGMMTLIDIARGDFRGPPERRDVLISTAPDDIARWTVTLNAWRIANYNPLPGEDWIPPPPFASTRKVGRNDPCPCGSGKKYKKCCGLN